MSGGLFRGTSEDQDTRFSNKQSKLLKSQKFPAELDQLVDMTKVKMDVVRPWIANRATELLGFEDEVLINFVYGLLDGKSVDGKNVQIQLTGFMEKNTVRFMKELWSLLLSAQTTSSGIPQQFLDAKEEDMRKRKVETDMIAHEIQKRIEREHDHVDDVAGNSRAADSIPDSVLKGLMQRASSVHSGEEREVNVRHGRRSSKRYSESPHSSKPHSKDRSPSHIRNPPSTTRSSSRGRTKSSSVSVSSLSQKHSMSPEKCCRSRSRRTPSPERRHRSPPRRSISLVRRRRSPPRRSIFPVRRHRSPPRRSVSPVRRRRSPPRRSVSPARRGRSPPRNYVSPARRYRSPPRRSISPSRRYGAPPRHSVSPRYSRRHRSPSRWYRAPRRHSVSPRRRYSPGTHRSPSRKNRRRSHSRPRQSSPSPSQRRSPYSHKRSPYLRHISPSPSHHRCPVRKQSSTYRRRSPIRRRSSSLLRHRSLSPPMTSPSPTSPKCRQRSPEHSARNRAADFRISPRGRKRSYSLYRSRSPRYPTHRSFSREPDDTTNGVKSQRTPAKSSPHDHAQDRGVAVSNDSERKVLDSVSCRLPNSIRSPQPDMMDPSDTCNRLPTVPPKESPNLSESSIHMQTTHARKSRSLSHRPVKQISEWLPHYASPETNLEAEQTMCVREEPQDKIDCLPYKIKEIPEVGGNKRLHTSDFSRGVHSPDRGTKLAERHVQRLSPSSGVEHGPGSLKLRSSSDDVHDMKGPPSKYGEIKPVSTSKRMSYKNCLLGAAETYDFQNIEKRSPPEPDKHKKDVDDESETEFEKDDRKETKTKRKERRRLHKEKKRQRREERRHRKLGRHANKLKTIALPSDVNKLDDSDLDTTRNMDSRSDDTELEQQKKLEIELRNKALESLRARKGIH